MRHRKSCSSSSGVGRPNVAMCRPAGSHWPTTWRTVPPLPEVSIPCSTSRTLRVPPLRPSAYSCSCSVETRSAISACAFLAAALPCLKPGWRACRYREVDGAVGGAEEEGDGFAIGRTVPPANVNGGWVGVGAKCPGGHECHLEGREPIEMTFVAADGWTHLLTSRR